MTYFSGAFRVGFIDCLDLTTVYTVDCLCTVFLLLLGVTKFLLKRYGNLSWRTFLVETVLDNERSQILHKQTALANAGGIFQLGAEC